MRYAQVVVLARLAISLGLLIALSHSALAAGKPSGVYQRLHELRVRAQALQALAAIRGQGEAGVPGFSRGSGSTTLAQLSAPQGAPPSSTDCQASSGGQCCLQFWGATLCVPVANGVCGPGAICCSEAARANGTCFSPPATDLGAPPALTTAPGVPATPTAGTCHLAQGGQCCQQTLGDADCAPVPASGTCAEGSTCCSEAQRTNGTCFAPPPAATAPGVPAAPTPGLCQAFGGTCCQAFSGSTLCVPASASGTCAEGSICCTPEQRGTGACRPPGLPPPPPRTEIPPIQPPLTPPPGAPPPPAVAVPAAPICPPLFQPVGGTCCSQSDVAYVCYAKSSGKCLPTDGSYNDGVVSACCREQTGGGACIPPPPSSPAGGPTATGGIEFPDRPECYLLYLVPGIGPVLMLACLASPDGVAHGCSANSDCITGQFCQIVEGRGVCTEGGGVSAQSLSACAPPSVMVEGSCCAPDAAAGTCGASRLSECTGGKVKRGEFCVCPQGTTENRRAGTCDKPPPVATGKKDTACKPGFRRSGERCVSACTGGKIYDDGACRCPAGTRENARGTCAKPSTVATGKNDTACKPGFQRSAAGACVRKVRSPEIGSGSRGGEKVNQPGGGRTPGILGGGLLESGGGGGGGGTTTPVGGRAPAIGGDGGAARTFRPR